MKSRRLRCVKRRLRQRRLDIVVRRGSGVKTKVLIVDDDAAVRQQLYWMLCDDYEVVTAHDLQSAMRGAMNYEPQIAILDLHLPPAAGTTEIGLHILEYLKEHRPTATVLVVSSDAGVEARKACARRGADAFLGKPFDAEALLSTVRRTTLATRLSEM
jgi:DNA-binding NtrC family response regulator